MTAGAVIGVRKSAISGPDGEERGRFQRRGVERSHGTGLLDPKNAPAVGGGVDVPGRADRDFAPRQDRAGGGVDEEEAGFGLRQGLLQVHASAVRHPTRVGHGHGQGQGPHDLAGARVAQFERRGARPFTGQEQAAVRGPGELLDPALERDVRPHLSGDRVAEVNDSGVADGQPPAVGRPLHDRVPIGGLDDGPRPTGLQVPEAQPLLRAKGQPAACGADPQLDRHFIPAHEDPLHLTGGGIEETKGARVVGRDERLAVGHEGDRRDRAARPAGFDCPALDAAQLRRGGNQGQGSEGLAAGGALRRARDGPGGGGRRGRLDGGDRGVQLPFDLRKGQLGRGPVKIGLLVQLKEPRVVGLRPFQKRRPGRPARLLGQRTVPLAQLEAGQLRGRRRAPRRCRHVLPEVLLARLVDVPGGRLGVVQLDQQELDEPFAGGGVGGILLDLLPEPVQEVPHAGLLLKRPPPGLEGGPGVGVEGRGHADGAAIGVGGVVEGVGLGVGVAETPQGCHQRRPGRDPFLAAQPRVGPLPQINEPVERPGAAGRRLRDDQLQGGFGRGVTVGMGAAEVVGSVGEGNGQGRLGGGGPGGRQHPARQGQIVGRVGRGGDGPKLGPVERLDRLLDLVGPGGAEDAREDRQEKSNQQRPPHAHPRPGRVAIATVQQQGNYARISVFRQEAQFATGGDAECREPLARRPGPTYLCTGRRRGRRGAGNPPEFALDTFSGRLYIPRRRLDQEARSDVRRTE